FSMAPGQNHGVEVAGALEGVTVADAIRFVSAGTSAPGINYVHTDHLGTPRLVSDQNQTVIWRWTSDPFGEAMPNENPDGDGVFFAFNLRFPGQYFDAETERHYNYFRDYDPALGRYVQSDPIGLVGGINTYTYVGGNPLIYTDSQGLIVCGGVCVGIIFVGSATAIVNWTRNYWNEPVKDIHDVNDWTELTPDESIYHRMGPGNESNRKFVSPDGRSEAVFD
ncbi:MAG: RHS domain-containing protein, partial [Nitrospira sp.]|nr:RHS domain-containing protein [Nitrospira sp.]